MVPVDAHEQPKGEQHPGKWSATRRTPQDMFEMLSREALGFVTQHIGRREALEAEIKGPGKRPGSNCIGTIAFSGGQQW